ncbi:heterodisulfide reductase-related iron-sulfur binding cluster [Rugosimonospora acidiphila]|uniref:Heterodisulfide reductase-related iron-sulfur binding cluster n=1 Tax=Rugosimonospora acidiphila TaxID=556531 RepID=A0ABP9RG57_9ACTN
MGPVQIVAATLAIVVTVGAIALVVRAVRGILRVVRLGQPDPERFDRKGARLATTVKETLGHTRMLRWTVVGVSHWFVMVGFGALLFTLIEAYGETFSPAFEIPVLGYWAAYGLIMELIAALTGVGIATLIVIRLLHLPTRSSRSRFAGSTFWQAYYVEYTIVGIVVCIFLIRGFKAARGQLPYPVWAAPISHGLGDILPASANAITITAIAKIIISMGWFVVIAFNLNMGIAWHRFAAFFNIFFKRTASAAPALGGLRPMMSKGKPLDFEEADPDRDQFGVAAVEQFTWKGLLDFTTCTECGRCQSQCPAWNTGKPLSPKLLVLSLRDHAYAKAPYLLAGGADAAGEGEPAGSPDGGAGVDHSKLNVLALAEAQRPLIGGPDEQGIVDPDVLWSCTTCGACVEQCPVDIEHVDHIVDMRRYQVLIESNFPSEAGVMLRNLESKGNPWGAPPATREDWTKGLDFEIPRVGDGTDFEYLFWVGCAGAFEDRAKKTTRAVATLLHEAGVPFAILGNGETCTGDPARRIGNEFLFQMLAAQNVETLNEAGVTKIVASCPHCFNTLANEYGQLGGQYQVIHHTQLLADLVGSGKLTPVQPLDGGLTYHDPCYLGRHNRVFTPPREVLGAAASGGITEMPRNSERSFCCGAGGARMWMEERIGKRINIDRVEEAVSTGAKTVAVGCPFCMTMLSDGVNAVAAGQAEVVDVATVLLRSVKPEPTSRPEPEPAAG